MLAGELFSLGKRIGQRGERRLLGADSEVVALETLLELNTLLTRRIEKETERAMERERQLLRQANFATMGEMIDIIAHQWRQPLGSLGLILQNLRFDSRDGVLDQAGLEEYLDRAQRMIDVMAATIDDFRLFFAPNVAARDFSLLATIRKCADLMAASLKTHGIELQACGDDVVVHGSENEFLHVMVNLVVNAKEAMVDRQVAHGRIQVGLGLDGDEAWICLSDNAGGIAPDIIDRVFDLHFTTKQGGSGIGLYLTRTIVEQHLGGCVWAENWQDGVRFTLRLPVRRETNA
jgi:signal transduction histidine kinase